MTVSVSDFKIRFPEFSDDIEFPDPRVQFFIDDTELYIGTDETRWGNKYDAAQVYLAAHLLSVGTSSEASGGVGGGVGASAGPIVSKSAGGVSVGRASSNKTYSDEDGFYMNTVYGQQFILIRNRCFAGILVAL